MWYLGAILAAGTELRKWFSHGPERWDEFRMRNWFELERKSGLHALLKHRTTKGTVTFVYAVQAEQHNSAMALNAFLQERM